MDRDDVIEVLARRPFRPLRVHLTDGASYDVRHPEQVSVGFTVMSVALEQNEELVIHWLSLIHLTRIIPI